MLLSLIHGSPKTHKVIVIEPARNDFQIGRYQQHATIFLLKNGNPARQYDPDPRLNRKHAVEFIEVTKANTDLTLIHHKLIEQTLFKVTIRENAEVSTDQRLLDVIYRGLKIVRRFNNNGWAFIFRQRWRYLLI